MARERKLWVRIGKGVIALALLLASLYGIGFVVYWTQGGTKALTTFYAIVDGKIVQDYSQSCPIRDDRQTKIEAKYLFSSSVGEHESEYTFSILPNRECDFDYTDERGQVYAFSLIPELTAGFDIKTESGVILIGWKHNNMSDLLSEIEGKKVTAPKEVDIHKADYFTLLLTSYNGKANVRINFHRLIGVKEVITEEGVYL